MSDLVKELGNWTIDTDARLESLHRRLNSIEEITLDQRDVVVMGLARRICELEAARAKLEAQRPLAVFDDGVAINHDQRIEALERQAHGTHSRHEEPTPNEQALHLRLAALEHQDLAKRITHLEETAVKRDMARGLDFEQVHPDEMMRLRRIETVAAELVHARFVGANGDAQFIPGPMLRRLREAVGDA